MSHTHYYGPAGSGKTYQLRKAQEAHPEALVMDEVDFDSTFVREILRSAGLHGKRIYTSGATPLPPKPWLRNVELKARSFARGKHIHYYGPKGSGKSLLIEKARRDDPSAVFANRECAEEFLAAPGFDRFWDELNINCALEAGDNAYSWGPRPWPGAENVKAELPALAVAQQVPGLKAEIKHLTAEIADLHAKLSTAKAALA